MVVATRLLTAAHGSGGFTIPSQIATLISAPHGGWTQTQGPHGVGLNGYTYFADVNGSTGVLEVAGIADATGTPISAITVHAAITSDTHDAPSLLIRASDHKLMVWYSGHNGATMYQRVSVNSLDSDPTLSGGFASETSLDATFGGTAYTYPFAGQLNNGSLWLGFRDEGAETYLCLAESTDNGATWSAETKLVSMTGVITYWMVHFGTDRIDIAVSGGNGITGTHVSMYHAYQQGGGAFKSSAGVDIGATQPWDPSAATLVHDGSSYPNAWPSGMSLDAGGAPVILYETVDTANGNNYVVKYARFASGSWTAHTVTSFSDSGMSLIAHSAFDEDNPDTVWTVEPVSGLWQLFRHTTSDLGVTWTSEQLTFGASDNVYPVDVKTAGMYKALVMTGSYTASDINSTGITGIR